MINTFIIDFIYKLNEIIYLTFNRVTKIPAHHQEAMIAISWPIIISLLYRSAIGLKRKTTQTSNKFFYSTELGNRCYLSLCKFGAPYTI